jgi:hypothetical protein
MLAEQIAVTLMVTDALDTLNVFYTIGGSLLPLARRVP